MPDLSRQLLVYSGIDQTPVNDLTDATDWTRTELTNVANGGEAGAGTWVLRVPDGDIPDLRASVQNFLGPHNVIKVTVGSNTLFRGRLNSKDTEKGPRRGTRPQEKTIILSDYNDDLRGIVVHDWSRPLETDAARAQVLVARYLSGSPRPSTNLNGSNYVITGSNTSNRGFKTYSAITPMEILQELAETADKEMFVDVDGALHYHGHDYSGFDSFMRISDDPADLNTVTFMPIAPTANEEGREQYTKLRSYWGPGEEQHTVLVEENPVKSDYWEEMFFDDAADNATEAATNARAILDAARREQVTYTMTVGKPGVLQTNGQPMTGDDIYKIKAGQRINVKARAARGGISGTGAFLGDTFQQMRIRSVTWTFPGPDQYYARLELEKPKRLRGRGKGQKKSTTPTPAPEVQPDEPGDLVVLWDFEDANALDTTDTYDSNLLIQPTAHPNGGLCPAGSAYCGYVSASHRATDAFPVTANTTYVFETDVKWYNSPSTRDVWVKFNGTSGGYSNDNELLIDGSAGYAEDTAYHITESFTTPPGTTTAKIWFSPFLGFMFDNMSVSELSGDPVENEEHAVDYGDCPHESGHFLPSDYVLCRLDALSDQIGDLEVDSSGVIKELTNKSSENVVEGDLVIVDSATDESFTTTDSPNIETSIGIAQETIGSNSSGRVLLYGYAGLVTTRGISWSRGQYAYHSSNTRTIKGSNTRAAGAVGQFLSTGTTPSLWLWGVGDQTAAAAGGGASLGAWTTYTPTWTATTTNPTLGSTTLVGRYKLLDAKTVIVQISLSIVTGGAFNAGSGQYAFSLPAGMTAATGRYQVGPAHILDSGTTHFAAIAKVASGGTTINEILVADGSAPRTFSNNLPITLATGDQMNLEITLEIQ